MGWNIILTNVPATTRPPKALFWVYHLRWHIELVFKAWKSHFRFVQFSQRNEITVRLSILTKLLFCLLVARFSETLESRCGLQRHMSLLPVARILNQGACLFAAAVLRLTPEQWLAHKSKTTSSTNNGQTGKTSTNCSSLWMQA